MRISMLSLVALAATLTTASCTPEPCTVAENDDGTHTLSCPDGTSATIGDGQDATPWLVRAEDEPAGANCEDGGVVVYAGPDSDGDGTLGESEAMSTTYVCDGGDGADGVSYLVSVVDEPAGENCEAGGVAVSVGPDDNDNGTLDEEEILSTDYVCDGVNGADGEDAIPTLVRTDEEPPGSNCENGGLAVSIGVDGNENGTLDDVEITSTEYVCNGLDGEDGADGADGSGGLEFPASGSTAYTTFSTSTVGTVSSGMYVTGAYVEDDLTGTGKTSITGLSYTFVLDDNTSSFCTVGTLDFDVKINGTKVDEFSYAGGSGRNEIIISGSAAFTPISGTGSAGDEYTIRYESADTVCSGGGSYRYYSGGVVELY